MPINIRVLKEGDEAVFDRVADDVFDDDVMSQQAARFLAATGHYIAVAMDADMVIGMGTANEYLHPDKQVQFWVNEMGVAPAYQRRGIGKRLLNTLLDIAREKGCEEVWLGTEEDNVPARALYESAGGRSEKFVMYTFSLSGNQ